MDELEIGTVEGAELAEPAFDFVPVFDGESIWNSEVHSDAVGDDEEETPVGGNG